MKTLAALNVGLVKARAERDRKHEHTSPLGGSFRKDCQACQFGRALQILGDRDETLTYSILDAFDDRDTLIGRVEELEEALGTAIVNMGAEVGRLEKLA